MSDIAEQELRFLRDYGGGSTAEVLAEWEADPEYERRVLAARSAGAAKGVPSWQFVDDAPLPGLAEIVPSIPLRHAPAAVAALMRTPQEELAGLSPIEHLASSADPAPVAAMLADLGRW